jgi:hypothetical protein
MERTGVATIGEIEPETLRQRISDELRTSAAVLAYPILLGAWGRKGPT